MFDDVIQYMDTYRINREKSLNNEQRSRWFTSDVDNMQVLMTKLSTDTENDEWETEYLKNVTPTGGSDLMKMQSARLKVHFIASLRQDIRNQYMVGGDGLPLVARTSLDLDRYNFAFLKYARHVCSRISRYVKELAKGAKN